MQIFSRDSSTRAAVTHLPNVSIDAVTFTFSVNAVLLCEYWQEKTCDRGSARLAWLKYYRALSSFILQGPRFRLIKGEPPAEAMSFLAIAPAVHFTSTITIVSAQPAVHH